MAGSVSSDSAKGGDSTPKAFRRYERTKFGDTRVCTKKEGRVIGDMWN
ncbi:hypothetical protein K0U07_00365 [bacterium]|nr:hypothetical protein [bacterium]